jgi:hypothetical protein
MAGDLDADRVLGRDEPLSGLTDAATESLLGVRR